MMANVWLKPESLPCHIQIDTFCEEIPISKDDDAAGYDSDAGGAVMTIMVMVILQ